MNTDGNRNGLFVQYGCGLSAPQGWRNFDASPTLRLQRLPIIGGLVTRGRVRFPANVAYGDVVRGLPLADASCDGIYCSHVLEHLSLADFRTALRESRRVLKPGGLFRGVMPDLAVIARAYVADPAPGAAVDFMNSTLLGAERRPRGLRGLVEEYFGNSRHLWLWDYKAAAAELEEAGFRDIRPAQFGDAAEPAFALVEEADRWQDALGFECRR